MEVINGSMPFQVNHSVFYPRGYESEAKLANDNAWVMIAKEKIMRRLDDCNEQNPKAILGEMVSYPLIPYEMKNVWYRFIL